MLIYSRSNSSLACGVDYPCERFRVVVLDDGAGPELKVLKACIWIIQTYTTTLEKSSPKYPITRRQEISSVAPNSWPSSMEGLVNI